MATRTRDAEGGPDRRPNFGRKVRKSGQIVASQSRGEGELASGQLHSVAGITGKTYDSRVQSLARLAGAFQRRGTFHGSTPPWTGHAPVQFLLQRNI
jgi:hypothetical protein